MTPADIIKATIGIGSRGHNQENKTAIPISKSTFGAKK
jgi:hypothetical protein